MTKFWAKKRDEWALVPCPRYRKHRINSSDVQKSIPNYRDQAIAEHSAMFDGLEVTKPPKPHYGFWKARIEDKRGRLDLEMTLQDDDEFGGFSLYGKFEMELLLAFWAHLRSEFPDIRVFAPDLNLYSEEGFKAEFG